MRVWAKVSCNKVETREIQKVHRALHKLLAKNKEAN